MTIRIISGIYAITNIINGKVYVGSTINFETRWKDHRKELRKGIHKNTYLQRSWNKYGESNFEFGVLEYLDNFEELIKAEQFWMDTYREEGKELYNFGLAADNPFRGCTHTEETRCRMSESARNRSEEHKRKLSEARRGNQNALGCKRSKETRQKLSEAHKGNKHSKETRQKMSESQKGRKHSEETRRKIGDIHRGKTVSEETRCKISRANTGYRHTEEAKYKIGIATRGRLGSMLGKCHSKETKQKMSKSQKVRWAKFRASSEQG